MRVPFGAAVSLFPAVAGHRDLAPGQGGELGIQAGLVALDDQQVVGTAPGQVFGVAALGMQRVGGDDRAGDVFYPVQHSGEHGNLVRFGAHLHLAQHHAMGVIQGCQQVAAVFAAVPRAA